MLQMADPHLGKGLHPTVICRGYVKALEEAVKLMDGLAFQIDINKREEMLKIINSTIGTKFTQRFGDLMAVRRIPGASKIAARELECAVLTASCLC